MMRKEEWISRLKSQPILWILPILLLGLILLLIPESPQKTAVSSVDLRQETEQYRIELTSELQELLCNIKGVGKVEILLTFENSVEYEYLKEESENTDTTSDDRSRDYSESYLMVGDKNGESGVLAVKRILPQVSGAAVICTGGADPLVRQQVIELLRAVLGVSAASISVQPLA